MGTYGNVFPDMRSGSRVYMSYSVAACEAGDGVIVTQVLLHMLPCCVSPLQCVHLRSSLAPAAGSCWLSLFESPFFRVTTVSFSPSPSQDPSPPSLPPLSLPPTPLYPSAPARCAPLQTGPGHRVLFRSPLPARPPLPALPRPMPWAEARPFRLGETSSAAVISTEHVRQPRHATSNLSALIPAAMPDCKTESRGSSKFKPRSRSGRTNYTVKVVQARVSLGQ